MPHIFLHIPKAGGSTLLEILIQQFGKEHFWDIEDKFRSSVAETIRQRMTIKDGFWLETSRDAIFTKRLQEFQQFSDNQKASIQLIRGHYAFNYYQSIPACEAADYFTMFRNPTDRLISHYSFARGNQWHYLHDVIHQQNLSFHEYLQLPVPELHNGMLRLIISKETEPQLSENHLTEAIKLLQTRFIQVGIIEMFDESLFLLGKALNWKTIPTYIKTNITENKIALSEIKPETIQLIEQNNALDIRLYQWVKQQFIQKWQQHPELHLELAIYRQKNNLYTFWNKLKSYFKRTFG